MEENVKVEIEKTEIIGEVEIDKPKIIGKVEIFILNNGQVTVMGPVNNPLLMMEIFGKAMEAVVTHIANDQSNGIVIPDQKIVSLN